MIDGPPTSVVTLEGVTVRQPSRLHNADATTPFPCQPILLVFDFHHSLTEGAFNPVEIQGVERDQFR